MENVTRKCLVDSALDHYLFWLPIRSLHFMLCCHIIIDHVSIYNLPSYTYIIKILTNLHIGLHVATLLLNMVSLGMSKVVAPLYMSEGTLKFFVMIRPP